MKLWIFIAVVGMALGAAALQAAQVGLIKIDGAIGPATANYIARAIDVSAAQKDECLIIQLDTPGGLLQSTKEIVQEFYSAKVPTVVYVSPSGASAASAGVFITLAADVAAMAPDTTIGAAHPVEMGVGGIEGSMATNDVMAQKLANYASSFIETIADKRHRNVEWAKSAVVESKAIPSEQARQLLVIDLIATNMPGSAPAIGRPFRERESVENRRRRGRGDSHDLVRAFVSNLLAAGSDDDSHAHRHLRLHRRNQPSGRDFPRRRGRAGADPVALHVGHAAAEHCRASRCCSWPSRCSSLIFLRRRTAF